MWRGAEIGHRSHLNRGAYFTANAADVLRRRAAIKNYRIIKRKFRAAIARGETAGQGMWREVGIDDCVTKPVSPKGPAGAAESAVFATLLESLPGRAGDDYGNSASHGSLRHRSALPWVRPSTEACALA